MSMINRGRNLPLRRLDRLGRARLYIFHLNSLSLPLILSKRLSSAGWIQRMVLKGAALAVCVAARRL